MDANHKFPVPFPPAPLRRHSGGTRSRQRRGRGQALLFGDYDDVTVTLAKFLTREKYCSTPR